MTSYDLFGIGPDATRDELDAAYRAKRAAYDPVRVATLGEEFVAVAEQRRAELDLAYRDLRMVLGSAARLTPAAERTRDRQTMVVLVVLVLLALTVPLMRNLAVPERSVTGTEADATALTAKAAPDFTLPTLDGTPISLSDFTGQVILINLWASWCPPCVRETPRLVRLHETYRDQGLVVLGVNTTYQDDRAKVAEFVRDYGVSYPVLLDTTDMFGQTYTARLLPTSYLIDRSGNIVSVRVGEVDEAVLAEQIEALLRAEEGTP